MSVPEFRKWPDLRKLVARIAAFALAGSVWFSGCAEEGGPSPEPEWQPSEGPISIDLDWERFDRKARFALRQDDYQGAIELLHRACDLRPQHAPGWDLLGSAYALAGRPGIGARLFEKAIAIDPDQAIFFVHLGKSLMDLTDYEGARAAYQKALEDGAQSAKVHFDLGMVAERQDRLRDAIGHFEDAIGVNANFADPYYWLGTAHEKLGDGTVAANWFEKALELNPGHMGSHYGLGLLYLRGDRPDAGREHMETFQRLRDERLARDERVRERERDRERDRLASP